ncbi:MULTISPECIES: hypothetical protein [Hungatella]|uniref:hypothetical protein n=1 Tax=Hungatella TaxID=1649459 RepID=UPI001FA863A3|nr:MULTISPECIES: hypothetical protein [Hungatella]
MMKGETADGLLSPGFPVWDIGRGGAAAPAKTPAWSKQRLYRLSVLQRPKG